MDGKQRFRSLFAKKTDTGKYSVHHYQYNPEEPYSISGNDVYTIFQDTRKRIWVGCFGGGLNLIKTNRKWRDTIYQLQ